MTPGVRGSVQGRDSTFGGPVKRDTSEIKIHHQIIFHRPFVAARALDAGYTFTVYIRATWEGDRPTTGQGVVKASTLKMLWQTDSKQPRRRLRAKTTSLAGHVTNNYSFLLPISL